MLLAKTANDAWHSGRVPCRGPRPWSASWASRWSISWAGNGATCNKTPNPNPPTTNQQLCALEARPRACSALRQCHVSIADGLRQACSLVPGPARTRASQNEYEGTKQILGLIRAQGAQACLEKLCPYCSHQCRAARSRTRASSRKHEPGRGRCH